ncbi:hypothetical protein BDP67DRAFT_116246 [Colletotrichum lupini]|nr:hypothetical protein BDP67DRAFT_116246 [Colletotrichum lupini]
MADRLDNTTNWQAPPRYLHWNTSAECALFADVAQSILRTYSDDPVVQDYCAVNVNALHAYFQSSLPLYLRNTTGRATSSQVASWYMLGCSAGSLTSDMPCESDECLSAVDFRHAILAEIREHSTCIKELRSHLQLQGNADIAGIGITISLCIESFLIFVLLVANIAEFFHRPKSSSSSKVGRVRDACRAVLPTFYWSSVIFNLGIVIASLNTAVAVSGDGQLEVIARWRAGGTFAAYDTQLATLISGFSFQPTFMAGLMMIAEPGRRRRALNTAIIPVLGLLLIPLLCMTLSWYSRFPETVSRLFSDDLEINTMVRLTLFVSFCVTWFLLVLSGVTVGVVYRRVPGESRQVSIASSSRLVTLVYLLHMVSLATMFTTLVVFFWLRNSTIKNAGGSDPQVDWGFGQVVALTTWIPVFVDDFYNYWGKSIFIRASFHVLP